MDDEARRTSTRCSNDGGGGSGSGGVGLIRRGVSFMDNIEPLPARAHAHQHADAQSQPQELQPPPTPTPPPPAEQQQRHTDAAQTWMPPRLQQPLSHGAVEVAPAVGGIGALRIVTNSDAQMRRMPSVFGLDAPSPHATSGGAGSIDPVLRDTMKAAIVDAKDLRDELKAAEARLSTKPTGIRPRDMMLPVRCCGVLHKMLVVLCCTP
eukprot:360219-Chlamydomonas_euryale.AAC.3